MVEVASAEIAVENYKRGIESIGGASKYYECGAKAKTGPAIEVAKCLKEAKARRTTKDWASKWAKRMYGS